MPFGNDVGRRSVLKGFAAVGAVALATACDGNGDPIPSDARQALNDAVEGRVFWKGDEAYEMARGATCYRMNKPNRYPQVVVQAEGDQDVVAAVKFAKEFGLKVTTRSGGHAWSASHIRDDCVLIDLSRMQSVEIDEETQTVWTNPGVIGSVLNKQLEPYEFIVPTAHHPSPGIGGFCMQGGFGWNSRLWGNGCHHVLAAEVVNADGELIYCDDKENSDFWWAVRGSGPGFFGVVTKLKLQCRPRPKVWRTSVLSFANAEEVFDELMTWAFGIAKDIPLNVETVVISTAHDPQTHERVPPRIVIAALALTDTEEEAIRNLSFFNDCPVRDKATFKLDAAPTDLEARYQSGYTADPAGFRFACDNFYTESPPEEVVPRLRKMFLELPTPNTHSFYQPWGTNKTFRDDAAFSMIGTHYLATYTLWTDPEMDEEMAAWPPDVVEELSDLASGAQMNDENMMAHSANYMSPEAYAKLEELRAKHDPDGVFETFMGGAQAA